jgi:hypothetical protein
MKNERILLCSPPTGLNDILVQVEDCYQYCKKNSRKLVVDGSRGGFLDDLANYFIPADKIITFEKIDFLNPPFDVFPHCLRDDIYNYELHFDTKIYKYITKDGIAVTFDFNKDYEEQILVHAQAGGGDRGIYALAKLYLKEDVKMHIKEIIENLKRQYGIYDAIHIRNTDHKTNYKMFFDKIKNELNKTTVICTDDYECQQYAKLFFGEKLIAVTDLPDLSAFESKTLHNNKYINRYKTNLDTLTDLFILACSERLFYTQITGGSDIELFFPEGGGGSIISGFLILAKRLHNNKMIIKNLLYSKKNSLIASRLALYRCHFNPIFSRILRKIRRFF